MNRVKLTRRQHCCCMRQWPTVWHLGINCSLVMEAIFLLLVPKNNANFLLCVQWQTCAQVTLRLLQWTYRKSYPILMTAFHYFWEMQIITLGKMLSTISDQFTVVFKVKFCISYDGHTSGRNRHCNWAFICRNLWHIEWWNIPQRDASPKKNQQTYSPYYEAATNEAWPNVQHTVRPDGQP